MISIIYPYRNRDLQRAKKSLDSLDRQIQKKFKVFFVDYGSSEKYSAKIKKLCRQYNFVSYSYCATEFQPWNKSRALNSVIKNLISDFCFVADIDIIFHPDFVKKAIQLQQPERAVYFQVGFLSRNEELEGRNFYDFTDYRKSTSEATGLSMFPVKTLKELRGFDEFYHFWGAEDTDIHKRLRNAGYEVEYFDKEVLMLHQWHPSYRSKETKKLTEDFQIEGIVQLNHQHLKFASQNRVTKVNLHGWGAVPTEEVIYELQKAPVSLELINEKCQVDDLLFGQLPIFKNKIVKVAIRRDEFHKSSKYKLKKLAGKKIPEFYSMKQVNDKILLHLISFYRDKPYSYKVEGENSRIILSIKL